MQLKKSMALIASITVTVSSNLIAAENELQPIIVTANRFESFDVDAPYASEVHTRKQIDDSGSQTLYDYLAQHSSVQVMPSFGNKFTPKIDMRGYGIGDGYQNIVVSIDGQRMNNIDMAGQLLGSIPLVDIDRIEITKGSGSVLYGDGAMAGTIQIHTRSRNGASVQAYTGNYGTVGTTASGGYSNEIFSINATVDHYDTDGTSKKDVKGNRADSDRNTGRMGLSVKPLESLKLKFDAASTRIDTRYPGRLTKAQLDSDPSQNGGATYTLQELSTDSWRAGSEIQLSKQLKLTASHNREDKRSRYVISGFTADYDYLSNDIAMTYEGERFGITAGYQSFDGERKQSSNQTEKNNSAWFAQGLVYLGATTFSAGSRAEKVSYEYSPNSGAQLDQSDNLYAWDIGANHRINTATTVFGNLNRAYQAPDIDRFFRNGSFNAFIDPSKAYTLNIGVNHVTASNRFKATLFRSNLKNEIYYYSTGSFLTSYNTNIDKSHKYGLELQDTWRTFESLTLSANYAYTKAIIDKEQDGAGAYDGKELPGVPHHNINLGANYKLTSKTSLNVSHVWRSSTWAAEDFDNNNRQKQRAYSITNLSIRHQFKDAEIFAGVDNIFERTNGLWVRDDRIYPVDFARTWRVGFKADF